MADFAIIHEHDVLPATAEGKPCRPKAAAPPKGRVT
jgi:hypothetical protein